MSDVCSYTSWLNEGVAVLPGGLFELTIAVISSITVHPPGSVAVTRITPSKAVFGSTFKVETVTVIQAGIPETTPPSST